MERMPTEEHVPEITDPVDLYSLPLDEFTAARDLLARRLRSQDRDDEANEVGRLRKPSVAAWALNRASRSNPGLVESLLDSHRQLRDADSIEAMQPASEARRQAVSALVEAGVAELRAAGRPDSAQTRERMNSTLLALATDPEGAARFQAGGLIRDLEPSGSGWGEMGLTPVPVDLRREALAAAERARSRADRLEVKAAEAERQLEMAERAVKEARRRAKAARGESLKAAAEAAQAEDSAKQS
jgi:hypothetical protein